MATYRVLYRRPGYRDLICCVGSFYECWLFRSERSRAVRGGNVADFCDPRGWRVEPVTRQRRTA